MEAFTTHTGIGVPLRRSNVDTDQIIPAEYLKRIERTGFGPFLFHDWRRTPDGAWISLSGTDPLNLVGLLSPGPRLPALTGNRVLYREWFPQIVYNHHQSGPAGTVALNAVLKARLNPGDGEVGGFDVGDRGEGRRDPDVAIARDNGGFFQAWLW